MANFTVEIPEELNSFIESKVSSGQFRDNTEVVETALRILEQNELENADKLAALRAAIDEGDASGDVEGDVFEQIRQELGLEPRRQA